MTSFSLVLVSIVNTFVLVSRLAPVSGGGVLRRRGVINKGGGVSELAESGALAESAKASLRQRQPTAKSN